MPRLTIPLVVAETIYSCCLNSCYLLLFPLEVISIQPTGMSVLNLPHRSISSLAPPLSSASNWMWWLITGHGQMITLYHFSWHHTASNLLQWGTQQSESSTLKYEVYHQIKNPLIIMIVKKIVKKKSLAFDFSAPNDNTSALGSAPEEKTCQLSYFL